MARSTCTSSSEEAIHRALCVRHPNCRELHFCFDCSRVFCADCKTLGIERLNHLPHRTATLQVALQQRLDRLFAIRKLVSDYILKHDMLVEALLKLETERKTQLDDLNGLIDEFADQLHREVDRIKNDAKQIIANRAVSIWETNPANARQKEIDKELSQLHEVRGLIEHEMCLCDRDELYLVEKNKDIESFAVEISGFLKKTYEIPDRSSYNLFELRRELQDQMAKLNQAKDLFLPGLQTPSSFLHPDKLCILPSIVNFPKEKLLLPNDKNELWIRGVIQGIDKNDSIYFVDAKNSKIKLLDIKLNQLTEVRILFYYNIHS